MIKYDEKCLFEWEIGVFGPPKTIYEGGFFPVKIVNFGTSTSLIFIMISEISKGIPISPTTRSIYYSYVSSKCLRRWSREFVPYYQYYYF